MVQSIDDRVRCLIADLEGATQEEVLCALRAIGADAVRPLGDAYAHEPAAEVRAFLVGALWEIRDRRAIPVLMAALRDVDPSVWKEALDGLVTLAGDTAVDVLQRARLEVAPLPDSAVRREWIDEAVEQLRERDG